MTVDLFVSPSGLTETFFDELDEIIEDTMIQVFVLQIRHADEISRVQAACLEHTPLFYAIPLSMADQSDENCVGYFVDDWARLEPYLDHTLFVEALSLDDEKCKVLASAKGVILNATQLFSTLPHFTLGLSYESAQAFDHESLCSLPMDRVGLQSHYPQGDFHDITRCVKVISDAMFRPEQSIVARATRQSLLLLGLR